jgi:hypothetical protein
MAEMKIGFVTFNPGSGDGDQAVTVSGEKYEGRVQRTQQVEFGAESGGVKKSATINQSPVAEFVKIDSTASVGKEGGTVTINGTSNSTKLTFSLTPDGDHPLTLELPANYQAAGKTTNNGATIADDPGATGSFAFSIVFSGIAENTDVNDLVNTLKVTAEGGQTANTVITQTAGDPFLEIDKNVINLDANGTPQTINVNSNIKWTITQAVSRLVRKVMK